MDAPFAIRRLHRNSEVVDQAERLRRRLYLAGRCPRHVVTVPDIPRIASSAKRCSPMPEQRPGIECPRSARAAFRIRGTFGWAVGHMAFSKGHRRGVRPGAVATRLLRPSRPAFHAIRVRRHGPTVDSAAEGPPACAPVRRSVTSALALRRARRLPTQWREGVDGDNELSLPVCVTASAGSDRTSRSRPITGLFARKKTW